MNLILRPAMPTAHEAPISVEQPLSIEVLQQHLQNLLPDASAQVCYEWYPNTSDVLIARSSFGPVDQLNYWSLRLIAVDGASLPHIRKCLLREGIATLADWFKKSDQLLQQDPSQFVCYSLTVRFEKDQLIYHEGSARRDYPRPETGGPSHPFRPHKS